MTPLFLVLAVLVQTPAETYCWPLDIPRQLTSSFAEYRPGRFHAGIDLRTPIVTLELRRGDSLSRAWTDTYPGLAAFVEHPKHYEPAYAERRRTPTHRSHTGDRVGN